MELAKADLMAVEMGKKFKIERIDSTSKESSLVLKSDNEETPPKSSSSSNSASM